MKTMRRACATLAGVVLAVTATAAPADAREKRGPADEVGRTITRVQLVRGGDAAKVTIELLCTKGQTFSLFVEVIQDGAVDDLVFDAYYTSKERVDGSCTGRQQRLRVLTVPYTGGPLSSPDSRLKKGPALETIGGDVDGFPEVTVHEVPVR